MQEKVIGNAISLSLIGYMTKVLPRQFKILQYCHVNNESTINLISSFFSYLIFFHFSDLFFHLFLSSFFLNFFSLKRVKNKSCGKLNQFNKKSVTDIVIRRGSFLLGKN